MKNFLFLLNKAKKQTCIDCSQSLLLLITLPQIICQQQLTMKNTGVYLLEVELGSLRYKNLPSGNILFTLRIGKNSTSISLSPINNNQFAGVLQLNVDSAALQAQRCSLSLNVNNPNDKRILGIALISLPKDKSSISNTYKLTQSQDKQAQIQLKIKIGSIDGSTFKNSSSTPLNDQNKGQGNSSSMSLIKVKSKHSLNSGEGENRKINKNYKIIEDQENNSGNQQQLKRYKAQKQAYYQMYQIEKSKNQVAAKFINTLIKKLTQKYPNLVPQPPKSTLNPELKKKGSDMPKSRNPADAATIQQLQQANKSLHRQVTQYKKVVDQLKDQLASNSKPYEGNPAAKPNTRRAPNSFFFDFGAPPRASSKDKSNIIPAELKENYQGADVGKDVKLALAGINLKEWLDKSITQRQTLQSKLSSLPSLSPEKSENKTAIVKKIRSAIDRAFSQLLSRSDLSKKALLSHKQQVNKILDDYISL